MEKKIKVSGFDCDNITFKVDEFLDKDVCRCDINQDEMLRIKKYIPMADAFDVVRNIIDASYLGDDGDEQYSYIANEYATRRCIVDAFSNIELPDDIDESAKILYTTKLYDMICEHAYPQVMVIIDEVSRQIEDINKSRFWYSTHRENNVLIHNLARISDIIRLGIENTPNILDELKNNIDTEAVLNAIQDLMSQIEENNEAVEVK